MKINNLIIIIYYYTIFITKINITSSMLNVGKPQSTKIYHGRFTRNIINPELLIPRHVYDNGTFKTFHLSNYYNRHDVEVKNINNNRRSKKRISLDDSSNNIMDKLHIILPFVEKDYHVELTPYYGFISPKMTVEYHRDDISTNLNNRVKFKRASDYQCHYRGVVRDIKNSRAALSLCDGMAGYVLINGTRYFIEPINESQPGNIGQHIHMMYKRNLNNEKKLFNHKCGTNDDWESAWLEQLTKRERRLLLRNPDGLKRTENIMSDTHSIHRYIEVGLVADKKFLDYHKDRDYEKYLLTIMNMVSDFYHDASVGNQIDVIVVRIIYLEKESEELDLKITTDADGTLDSFAEWAEKINPKDLSHPNHYDVAVLITRYDICTGDDCELMGLAFVASVCDPPKAAAICEDAGLILGVVVAHELGHVMGCSHDEENISGCRPQDQDETYFVMSPIVSIYSYRWSTCSKQFITSLLKSGLGECLNNNPKDPPEKYNLPRMLPGAMYDADFQCNLHYPGSVLCDLGKGINCEQLWCKKEKKCLSKNAPPADGTKCGEQKWCIKKKCVDMGARPQAIHGSWGEWKSSTSKCSRTCGGGITAAERECDNPQPSNGGRYCIGERKRVYMCNTQPCKSTEPSFRGVQCAEFNNQKVSSDNLKHKWTPYFQNDQDPCALFCVNDKNVFSKLAVAKDATPCKGGTNNICIAGACRNVGCDWVIDSNAIEDKCGVCNGAGTKCKIVEGKYKETPDLNYQKIVTIPKGASNIHVMEDAASQNALAIKLEKDNTYCLNGDHKEAINGEYPCAGALIIYSHPETDREAVDIKGPTQEDIQLQYTFYSLENPGVTYEYYIMSTVSSGYTPKYLWDFTHWSSCDANCGGGTMISQPSCIEEQNGIVTDDFCSNVVPRPEPQVRICNEQPCPTKWRVSQWSKCSGCNGEPGEKTRKIQCVKKASRPGDDDIQVDFSVCEGNIPVQSKVCDGNEPCKSKCPELGEKSYKRDNTFHFTSAQSRGQFKDKNVKKLKNFWTKNFRCDEERKIKKNVKRQFHVNRDVKNDNKRKYKLKEKMIVDTSQMKTLSTLQPGSIVKDNNPSENSVLLEAPLKADTFKANLSDVAFHEGGDLVPAEIDTGQEKIYYGNEAQKLSLELANNSNATTVPD